MIRSFRSVLVALFVALVALVPSSDAEAVRFPVVFEGTVCSVGLIPTCGDARYEFRSGGVGVVRVRALGTTDTYNFNWRYNRSTGELDLRFTTPVSGSGSFAPFSGCRRGRTSFGGYNWDYDFCRV